MTESAADPAAPPSPWLTRVSARFGITERRAATILLVSAAVFSLLLAWAYLSFRPSTDDGYVLANIVGVASRVAGPVIAVHVRDNQRVAKGDLLFELDPEPYATIFERAKAEARRAEAEAVRDTDHFGRVKVMAAKNYLSQDEFDTARAAHEQTAAAAVAAKAALRDAELNLGYTKVYATVSGVITNMRLSDGVYVRPGQQVFALIDDDSWFVVGYFEETALRHIRPGMQADVRFLMYPNFVYHGTIEGIGWGVFQPDGSSEDLLPAIKPTVDWVRLAARFPVRINLRDFDPDRPLRVGGRVTVKVKGSLFSSDE
jgi:multidrug resistance efflux pump